MSGAHIVENTNTENTNISKTTASTPPPNNEELLKSINDLADRIQKLDDKLENLEPLRKFSRLIGRLLGKSSNDNQENSKDAQEREEALKEAQEENTALKRDNNDLARERDKLDEKNKTLTTEKENLTTEKDNLNNQLNALQKQVNELKNSQQVLENEKTELTKEKTELIEKNQKLTTDKDNLTKANTDLTEKNKTLTTEKDNLNNQLNASQKQVNSLEQSQQVLENEKAELLKEKENLTKEKENLNTDLSNTKNELNEAIKEKEELEQKHDPYKKLDKLYEVFLEVKGCLNFNFVEKTHSAVELIAYVLSDSRYYVESLYKKASQELSDKRSDKGEKLAELFDLLFEHVKDSKFERLKEPSAYDSTCQRLYPEQNTSKKMQRVVLIGYTYDKKASYHTIVDMGS